VRAGDHSLELAKQTSQPSTQAIALHFAAMLHQLRGDVATTAKHARAAQALAAKEGFLFWGAGATIFAGWAAAASGKGGGVETIQRGLSDWLATGSRTYQPYYLGLLADALLRQHRPRAALPALEQAIAAARALPEGLYEAELHRLKAAALRDESADRGAVEAALTSAVDVARRQSAKLFESRAAADRASLRK
jgi:adenylate cyclase